MYYLKLGILFLVISLFYPSFVDAYSKGEFNYSAYYFQSDSNSTTYDQMLDFNARLDVKDYLGSLGYKVRVASTIDTQNDSRNRFIVEDMWLQYPFANVSFKVGSQLINWTSLEVFHPVDVVNSYYVDSSFAFPEKIGEPSIRLSYQFPTSTFVFLYMPTFQQPMYPNNQNRFSGSFAYDAFSAVDYDGNLLSDDEINQYAFLYEFMLGSADLNLSFVRHIDRRQPVTAFNTATSELTALFMPVYHLGFGYQFALGTVLLKSEVAYKNFSSTTLSNFGTISQLDHLQLAIGSETTLYHPNNFESTFLIEFQTLQLVSEEERASLSLFQHDLFLGYRLNLNDSYSTELFSSLILDTERFYEILFNIAISRKVLDKLIIDIGFVKCMAKAQGDGLGLINLANLDHNFIKLSYPL